MKKNVLFIMMVMAMMLCACGGSSKKIEGEVKTSNDQTQEIGDEA